MGKIKMKEIIANNPIKGYIVKFLILASIVMVISQLMQYSEVGYILLVFGASIVVIGILTPIACSFYNGSYYLVLGTFVGLMVSIAPAMILDSLRTDNLWIWAFVLGYGGGGYLSLRDIDIRSDDPLDTPLITFLSLYGVFVAMIVSGFILSMIIYIILSPFQISLSSSHIVIISFIIANIMVANYLSEKLYSEDLEKIDCKPHVRGVFGSFLGGILGISCSFVVGYIYGHIAEISMNTFWFGSYIGLVTGVLIGFFFGYKIEILLYKWQKKCLEKKQKR